MLKCDVLVLAGAADLYTIFYEDQLKALTNARSVTGRLFTAEDSADHHCQIGNPKPKQSSPPTAIIHCAAKHIPVS